MGASVSVRNQTPYIWHYEVIGDGGGSGTLYSGGSVENKLNSRWIHNYLKLRYGPHSWNSFSYEFNSNKGNGDITFTIIETSNRSYIQLLCSTENNSPTCPNYGKQEEDRIRQQQEEMERRRQEEQRRQQQEERRRQEQLERERRIQQEIERESELSGKKVSMGKEKLRQKLSLKAQQFNHQRTQVLHQTIEDDAAAIQRDEPADLTIKFDELLEKYEITEDRQDDKQEERLENRMKSLLNELTLRYFGEPQQAIWCQLTIDRAISEGQHSLTEKFSILTAVTELTLANKVYLPDLDQKYDFLICLLQHLYSTNPTLAQQLLLSILTMFPEVSEKNKLLLRQILFNMIWAPSEILLFLQGVLGKDQELVTSILHTVRTNKLDLLTTLSALKENEPVKYLQLYAETERDKDANTIVNEMRNEKYPDKLLSIMEEILGFMTEELPKHAKEDLNPVTIDETKQMIKSLDLTNPDLAVLKVILLRMSIAVQDCSTIYFQEGKNIEGYFPCINPQESLLTAEKIEGYFPRLTQLASLLMLLLPQLTGEKGILLEIGTGEGKSCILAMFATIQAIRGINIDIVTSSPVLARRDQEEWKKLYDMFGVTSSVVPPPQIEGSSPESRDSKLQEAYKKQLVYGTVGSFAADALRQEFEKDTTRGERTFDMVIVDEVDYMTLDNGVQVTFLSHEASGLRHLDQVLASIWSMVSICQPIEMEDTGEIEWATGIQHFHKAAKVAVIGSETSEKFSEFDILATGVQLGIFSGEEFNTFMQVLEKNEKDNTMENREIVDTFMAKVGVAQQCDLLTILESALENTVAIDCYTVTNNKATLVEKKTLDHNPDILDIKMLLLENGRASEILPEDKLIKATVSELKSKITYSDNTQLKLDVLVIPSFLEKYLEDRLPVFVQNALKAIMMTQGREYMIDQVLEDVSDKHLYHAIIPVDFQASGVLEKNKRWGDGLQQFLEIKHHLAITPLSNVTNYLSNFHYFKRYLKGNGLFGVSGTLGGNADKDFLARHYETNSYTIPAHRHKKDVELPAIQVSGKAQWMDILCKTAWRVADGGQVVLVVCEDVKTANELQNKMLRDNPHPPITLYTISEKHNIETTKFIGGHIIIATNLGGRGTDIKVDKDVNLCGGLFVLLTHYPGSRRVEKQVFGRTGRKGNPGMVQMIVCEDKLAPAYQGQPVEIMRQLREDYEVERIKDMETDELLEIKMKEDLFETFCQFLERFDSNFTKQEKEDLSGMKQNDVPQCFTDRGKKFDYNPALNALKETWALWLTLHEEHINRHEDIDVLKADLLEHLTNRRNMLLNGKSLNFYDHIKQAIGRTDLHCRNKNKCDYGAKSYWKDVEDCDPFYGAVALYNQAFITINLAKGDYKAEARSLLEKAETKIDVYLSETTNTMVSFQMATRGNFEPHHEGEPNFLKQIDSRMSIYKAWIHNITLAVNKLKELQDKETAITEESSVFSLSENQEYITANEFTAMYENGLFIVFEVKKKPEFCFDALICFFIGMCQVIIGILICGLSFGAATNIGISLISEGVSDMIEGITGMITGTFDWASWAISKSISIGMSLLSAGFSVLKKVAKSAYHATKGLLNGTKTLSSVAKDVIGAGKHAFKSIKGAVKAVSTGVLKSSTANIKTALKHATKYAVQEAAKQGIETALNYTIDTGIQAVFKEILKDGFKISVSSTVNQNAKLGNCLTEYIASAVPKGALQNSSNYKIDPKLEQQMKDLVQIMTKDQIPELMNDDTTSKVSDVISRLSEVSKKGLELVENSEKNKLVKGIKISLKIAEHSTNLAKMVQSIPTEHVINDIFVLNLVKTIEDQQQYLGKYDQIGRHGLPDVIRLKNEFLFSISESVSEAFIDACSGHMSSFVNGYFKKKFNGATGKVVNNVIGRYKTEAFFKDLQHKHDMKTASQTTGKASSETETKELLDYAEKISDVNRPASVLDIYVLTNSDLLQGKGIHLTVLDQHGITLSEESYPGTNRSAGQITLRLTKEPQKTDSEKGIISKVKDRIKGVQNLYSGHFDLIQDGKVITVHSKNQNSFYTAMAQATMSNKTSDEINNEAVNLRNNVKDQIKNNLPAHYQMVQSQRAYDALVNNCGKYTIVGGSTTDREIHVEYEKNINPMKKACYGSTGLTEYKIAKIYHLALVGPYKRVKYTSLFSHDMEDRGIVEADQIPPKDSLKLARDHPQIENLRQKNPKLYDMINSIESDPNGMNLLAMRVLKQHHRDALTTGSSKESDNCRKLLADTLVNGDAEKSLKLSFIMAHPVASNQLLHNAGNPLSLGSNANFMSTEGTVSYYKAGFNQMLNQHNEKGIIDQNQLERLKSWVADDKYLDLNTPEYTDVLKAIECKNLP
ncbi:uncharacterized protein LOC105009149 isoform X1 [Esox lucius]|uniref:uncharacterized protein LOC105009149 isoform X1 n=2 Tax=Esox lucius TaxID=8010 RepID=UPI0014776CEC|nr:uncharacterized protein LOC105009149 isoform X1 [Esox lucius]XP_028980888.2 uncharacterized protein LOC105009149 isoform X1 [Esox lucius]XP_034152843.1 uncharacterized protein LOC105009149 isoform X1 [Esox lucius]